MMFWQVGIKVANIDDATVNEKAWVYVNDLLTRPASMSADHIFMQNHVSQVSHFCVE